jgi:methylmalonyl-CoA mutase cobalamin-binding subunit
MPRPEGAIGGVTQFAAEVVARLVQRDQSEETGLREVLVERFIAAVSSHDPEAFEILKPELRRARVSATAVADLYIPEVARRLGAAWEADCLSFAAVTMGVARLQAILREIGAGWAADREGAVDGPVLLLVLPQGEQHTLGAMVLAGRLRRMGISVSMRIAPTPGELAEFVADRTFDGALVSIACNERLDTCRKLVKTLKESSKGALKVAVGGAIIDASENVMRSTGADMVTNDILSALAMMGVTVGRYTESELT